MIEAILALIAAVVGALFLGRWQGKRGERDRQEAQHARDYRDTRKEIDNADLGLGASDADRIDRLREIARRRGSNGAD